MAGRHINDLTLYDAPVPDPRDTDWYRFAREIDDLIATGEYTWAEATLTDLKATVEHLERVTEGQRRAVANIALGTARGRRTATRRRYDSFRGSWR